MDSGVAVVIGAIVGALASLGGTLLAEWIKVARERKLDRVCEDTLRKRFEASDRQWVPLEKLMECIGADDKTTIRYLLMIGARRSLVGNNAWGLKDWPEPRN
jgi:hypothetical protein